MSAVDLDFLGDRFGLADRVALVTGARQGVGRAIAIALARAGARVVVTSRGAGGLQTLAAELEAIGREHLVLELELTDEASVVRAVALAAERWGRLDVVVNNAAVSIRGDASGYSARDWDTVVDTNLRGTFLVCRAAAEAMSDGGGRIVNLSSTFARAAVPGRAAYAASKAGVEQLTRTLAAEWAPRGITVNAVAPGATLTETRQDVLSGHAGEERAAQIPLGRLGTPEDVVGAVLLLAGAGGGFITGATIVVDGGYTLGRGG